MKIQRLAVENFKSFDRLDLELGAFNVFIGANASGKSNVLRILEFLRDIAASGLRNAVSMQGDVEFLRNINIGAEVDTRVEFSFSVGKENTKSPPESHDAEEPQFAEAKYTLCFGYEGEGQFNVIEDNLKGRLNYLLYKEKAQEEKAEPHRFLIRKEAGKVKVSMGEDQQIESTPETKNQGVDSGEVLLGSPSFGFPVLMSQVFYTVATGGDLSFGDLHRLALTNSIENQAVYDFDTRTQRKAAPITGKSELEEDGSNVALVLKNLLEDEEKRRRFTNLIQYVLPFVKDVDVERFAGRSLIATLEETHTPGTPLPASLFSEGTIKVIALLIALYFEEKPVIAFEEPASNLHPKLISRVVEMMKEQSKEKQIFITTHSPEVIKHAGLENVYLVARDADGFSTVTKPAEKEEVRIFLENEMGIDDLFVQGLLEI